MRHLFFECNMGAAGDMLAAALYELLSPEDQVEFLISMNQLGIEGLEVKANPSQKCGIYGTKIEVLVNGQAEESIDVHDHDHSHEHHHEHHHHSHEEHHVHSHGHCHCHSHDHDHGYCHDHSHEHHNDHDHTHDHHHDHEHPHHAHFNLSDVRQVVEVLPVSAKVKEDVLAVYQIIGEAESHSHQIPIDQVHFHEVGQIDAIVDVTMVAWLLEKLQVEKIYASPVNTGSGNVRCAHGILPVPAPATAYILQEIPSYANQIKGELTTPTGAALLKYYVREFIDYRPMGRMQVGYGMGSKDFAQSNCVRAFHYEVSDTIELDVLELTANIDDMTPEALSFACEYLLNQGALDVYVTPIHMKKNRTGFLLTVTCREADRALMIQNIFKHTTTIGIKENRPKRYALKRQIYTEENKYGKIRFKQSEGYGVVRKKYEFDDLKAIAKDHKLSIHEVLEDLD